MSSPLVDDLRDEAVNLASVGNEPLDDLSSVVGLLEKAADEIETLESSPEAGGDIRKSIDELKREYDLYRPLFGKPFFHRERREQYQLLRVVFDERTNETLAVYCLSSLYFMHFARPMTKFLEAFEEGNLIDEPVNADKA